VVGGATASTLLDLTNGGALVNPFPGIAPSIDTVQSGIWHPSSRQASVGVEHELTANLTSSVNYLFVQGRQLPRTVNVNLPPPTVLTLANASTLGDERHAMPEVPMKLYVVVLVVLAVCYLSVRPVQAQESSVGVGHPPSQVGRLAGGGMG